MEYFYKGGFYLSILQTLDVCENFGHGKVMASRVNGYWPNKITQTFNPHQEHQEHQGKSGYICGVHD